MTLHRALRVVVVWAVASVGAVALGTGPVSAEPPNPAEASPLPSNAPASATPTVAMPLVCEPYDHTNPELWVHTIDDLEVTAAAPESVPFGGTFPMSGVHYTATYDQPEAGLEVGTYLFLTSTAQTAGSPAPFPTSNGYSVPDGTISSSDADGAYRTWGPVGSTVSVRIDHLDATITLRLGGTIYFSTTLRCDPPTDAPSLVDVVVGPPTTGAPVDEIGLVVADAATGAPIYVRNSTVTSGGFVVVPDALGGIRQVSGSATFPGLRGGTATVDLLAGIRPTPPPLPGLPFALVSIDDPSVGLRVDALAGKRKVRSSGAEWVAGAALGELRGTGRAVVVYWLVRDLVVP